MQLLDKHGIKIDCSVVPQLDLSFSPGRSVPYGNDYTKANIQPSYIHGNIFEVPMTSRKIRHLGEGTLKHKIKNLLMGENCWLRPISSNLKKLLFLTDYVEQEEKVDYLEFMIHSSELLPGGSPYCKTEKDVEQLYTLMEEYFSVLQSRGYVGVTLKEYTKIKG